MSTPESQKPEASPQMSEGVTQKAAANAVAATTELSESATLRPITPEDITAEANRSYDLGRKHGIGECQDELDALRSKVAELEKENKRLLSLLKTQPDLGNIAET